KPEVGGNAGTVGPPFGPTPQCPFSRHSSPLPRPSPNSTPASPGCAVPSGAMSVARMACDHDAGNQVPAAQDAGHAGFLVRRLARVLAGRLEQAPALLRRNGLPTT